MTLNSMTGFGRDDGAFEAWSWVWEIRAVNGKGLDVRLRLPSGFEILEVDARKIVGDTCARGNLQIALTVQSGGESGALTVNADLLAALIEAGQPYVEDGSVDRPRLASLYRVTGVVSAASIDSRDEKFKLRNEAVLKSLKQAMDTLSQARKTEGEAMHTHLIGCVDEIDDLTQKARACEGADAAYIKARFEEKFKALISDNVPEDRLATEAALLAVKADIREELDRLDAHCEQAQALLKAGSPVGRKLDFLSQEFIREINTLCSKSSDIDLTQIGLSMKSLVEQFREQAANVE